MTSGKQKTELLVGAFLLGGLILLGALIFQFGRFRGPGGENYPIHLVVRDASGLRVGAPVRLGGVAIGEVGSRPELSEDFTRLSIELLIEEGRRIPRESTFQLATSGLLGDSYVRITPPADGAVDFFVEGDRIALASGAKSIDDVATDAVQTLDQAAEVLAEVGRSVEAINLIFKRFDEELLNDENLDNVQSLLSNLSESSARIEKTSRRLDPLLTEIETATRDTRGAATSATEAFTFLQGEVGEISDSLAAAGPVITEFDGSLDDLRETLQSLDSLLVRIEHGGGVASALIHDAELRRDLESFVDKLERNGILRYPRDRSLGNSSQSRSRRETDAPDREEKSKKRPLLQLFRN